MNAIQASVDQAGTAPSLDISAKKALVASTIGYAMDGYDFLILAFMLVAIGADLGLSPAQRGSLATWTLIGAVIGGIGFGILSDYYGRVRVLTWTILLFAIFSRLRAFRQRLLGFGRLSHHRRPRPRRRVRHRHGVGCRILAGGKACTSLFLCRSRLAGGGAAGGADYASFVVPFWFCGDCS